MDNNDSDVWGATSVILELTANVILISLSIIVLALIFGGVVFGLNWFNRKLDNLFGFARGWFDDKKDRS